MDAAPMSGEERTPSLDSASPLGNHIVEVLVDTRCGRRVNEAPATSGFAAGRSSWRALWPVIASRSALRTSAAEERPAIAWLFVVGNVQFSGEP